MTDYHTKALRTSINSENILMLHLAETGPYLTFIAFSILVYRHQVIIISQDQQELCLQEPGGGAFQETQGSHQEHATILILKPLKHLLQQSGIRERE